MAGVGGKRRRGVLFNAHGVAVWDDKKVLGIDCGDRCTTAFNASELYTDKWLKR